MTRTTSVVICAYTERRWDRLLAAVASVRTQQEAVDEIVVVVDHHDVLRRRLDVALADAAPDVTVLANENQRGLSGARNTGIAHTRGDIVIFLDDDAVAEPDWTRHLVSGFDDAGVLGVGGTARPVWETAAPAWWPPEFGWVVGCSYRGQPHRAATVRNLMGCNMALRRDVLDAVGAFDAGLGRTADRPLGCEETELCIRATKVFPGGRFLYEPQAVVHHAVPEQRASWTYFRDRCRAEGVSKAWVAARVGRDQALESERSYVTRVLPTGIVRHLGAALRGDVSGLGRAGAVVAGLAYTTTSFLRTRHPLPGEGRRRPERDEPGAAASEPVKPLVVDLNEPFPLIDPHRADAAPYRSALCLVTDGGDPVAKVRLELTADPLPAGEVQARLRRDLAVVPGRRRLPIRTPADVSVVVATRDRPELLRECLDSIFTGTFAPQQVIVVDNAPSDDRTAVMIERLATEEHRLVYVREPRPGLARAHNAALAHVTSPLVAFTDDDVIVDRRWLERMALAFDDEAGESDGEADVEGDGGQTVCVTGLIAPRELETLPQQWIEGNTTYDKGLARRSFDSRAHRPPDPLFPYASGAFGSGANMGFRTSYLRDHGGFDVALGTGTFAMGGDDLAAFYDVVASGHRLVYEPAAIVLHRHHREYAGLRRQTYGYGAGLGAHLMRCFLRDPRMGLTLLRHAATARRRATAIVTPSTVPGLPPYPADLSREQLRGLVSGPWRYLVSRQRVIRHARGKAA